MVWMCHPHHSRLGRASGGSQPARHFGLTGHSFGPWLRGRLQHSAARAGLLRTSARRRRAFRDHWGSTETTAASWAHFIGYEALRPKLSFLAYADGVPLGVIMGHEYDSYTQATGKRDLYIPLVGTRRAGRKRGIAVQDTRVAYTKTLAGA